MRDLKDSSGENQYSPKGNIQEEIKDSVNIIKNSPLPA